MPSSPKFSPTKALVRWWSKNKRSENKKRQARWPAFTKWCSGRDSNPHGSLHTPLKRARLPITPPEQFDPSKNYFLAGALTGAFFAGVLAAGTFAAGAAFALASPGIAVFAFASAGAAVFALASAVFALTSAVLEFDETGASGLVDKTEMLPVNAGIASSNADSMNVAAAVMVTFERTVAVPRGEKAELDTLLVNSAPASVLPGCSKTAATSTRHERKNIPYKI